MFSIGAQGRDEDTRYLGPKKFFFWFFFFFFFQSVEFVIVERQS